MNEAVHSSQHARRLRDGRQHGAHAVSRHQPAPSRNGTPGRRIGFDRLRAPRWYDCRDGVAGVGCGARPAGHRPDGQITSDFQKSKSSPGIKNKSLNTSGKSPLETRPSHPMRGADRDRHERAVGCGDAMAANDECRHCVRKSRVVLTSSVILVLGKTSEVPENRGFL